MENVLKLEERLQRRDEAIKELEESIKNGKQTASKVANLLKTVRGRHKGLIEQKLEELSNGKVTLAVKDYYQFWTDLHVDNDVIFFRCTSKINPTLWSTSPDMQLYERRQAANIVFYRKKDPKDRENAIRRIRHELSDIHYDGENNFERIFMIDGEARNNPDQIDSLVETITRQVKNGTSIKTICIKSNEIPTFSRPQDFGIVITDEGVKLSMYLEVGADGAQEGGQILFDRDQIKGFENHYTQIEKKARQVKTENAKEIRDHVLNQFNEIIDISEIYGNRCYNCLLEGETKANSADWEKDRTPKRVWYEIIREENDLLRQILLNKRPRDILEIGCGAGRVIRLAVKLEEEEGQRIGWQIRNIESYEQNDKICAALTHKFKNDNRITIYSALVGRNSRSKRFHRIMPEHMDQFDLVLAVSNLVGWQDNEEEWVTEVLRAGKSLFFTVYKKGNELERVRMYQAAGDVVSFTNGDIELLVDAFENEKHVTKAYDKNEIERKIMNVASEVPLEKPKVFDGGKYIYGFLLTKK